MMEFENHKNVLVYVPAKYVIKIYKLLWNVAESLVKLQTVCTV